MQYFFTLTSIIHAKWKFHPRIIIVTIVFHHPSIRVCGRSSPLQFLLLPETPSSQFPHHSPSSIALAHAIGVCSVPSSSCELLISRTPHLVPCGVFRATLQLFLGVRSVGTNCSHATAIYWHGFQVSLWTVMEPSFGHFSLVADF